MNSLPLLKPSLVELPHHPAVLLQAIREERIKRNQKRLEDETARNAEEIRARCKTLSGFVKEAWRVLEPNATLIWNWHLDAICAHLEAITFGRINRLLINVPPGSSKSLIVSVLWPAWEWSIGLTSLRYLTTSHNDVPVKRDTRKTRDLILSPWFRSLWPNVVLTRTGETSFANSDTGAREGVAFGSLTSQRGDRLIIDDPHSTETAESPAERERTTLRFREGALNRLNDQEKSAIVVIMQRLHEDDVSGVVQKLGMDFVHLCLPMEFEPDRRCSTVIGFTDPRETDGEILDPVRFPRTVVDTLKRDMGSYAWAGQYQQRPAPRDGSLFKRSWFHIVDAAPASGSVVRSWDLAATEVSSKGDPDWTAGVRMRRGPDGVFYIEDIRRDRLSALGVETLIINTASQDSRQVRITAPQDPGQAGKSQALQLVQKLAGYVVKIVSPTGSKTTRSAPFAAQAEAGNVRIVRGSWNEAFLSEVASFPAGAHDDQIDAAADAFNELVLGDAFDLATFIKANR